jgi:D-aminopeptidase
MRKQLFIFADVEGASQITEDTVQAACHDCQLLEELGRNCITSDTKAVCDAVIDFGIDEIVLYDGHASGEGAKPNVKIDELPEIVKIVETPEREFEYFLPWIRGQVQLDPFGMVFVGQHARAGTKNAFFPHSIQTPPLAQIIVNGYSIAEIGMILLHFQGVKFLANIGDSASMIEARELCPSVTTISVKDKATNWVPTLDETYKLIKEKVKESLQNHDNASGVSFNAPYSFKPISFSIKLSEGFCFTPPEDYPWKGTFTENTAQWDALTAEAGFDILWAVRKCIEKKK